ncbi:MAG: hypothetical protein ABW192_02940, partial [Sphingobium sp.]
WGRETFSATVHAQGRTLRALCEMDEARLHREVSWSVAPDWTPRDGFVRVMRDGVTIGSCWYRISGLVVECEGVTETHGRLSVQAVAADPIRFLGTHPLAGDCAIAAIRGRSDPGCEIAVSSAVNSLAPLGDEGLDVQLLEPLVAYMGPETITVRAGTFDADRYTIRWSDTMPHVSDFWVHGDDFLPLLTIVPATGERFELTQLDRF